MIRGTRSLIAMAVKIQRKMSNSCTFTLFLIFILSCTDNKKDTAEQALTGISITSKQFGHMPDGREVHLFTLCNEQGMEVDICNYGGIITSIRTPDRDGVLADIVLGFDSLAPYLKPHPSFGVTVGRYANRIAGARFEIDGIEYRLAANNGPNHIHGGVEGFSKKLWAATISDEEGIAILELSYTSPDGEEGYPGTLQVSTRFSLNNRNELRIAYRARTDKATHVNLTNHSYFNLNGSRAPVLDHVALINARQFLPVDASLIPIGAPAEVYGTPFDFTVPKSIGRDISGTGMGYDHTFIIDREENDGLAYTARVDDPMSGRYMETYTTQPGVQFYTGNFLNGSVVGKDGIAYDKYWGFCLETHHYPDSPNRPEYPATLLRPGDLYEEETVYRFGITGT
jgi:aldose 1-epimerase